MATELKVTVPKLKAAFITWYENIEDCPDDFMDPDEEELSFTEKAGAAAEYLFTMLEDVNNVWD